MIYVVRQNIRFEYPGLCRTMYCKITRLSCNQNLRLERYSNYSRMSLKSQVYLKMKLIPTQPHPGKRNTCYKCYNSQSE